MRASGSRVAGLGWIQSLGFRARREFVATEEA